MNTFLTISEWRTLEDDQSHAKSKVGCLEELNVKDEEKYLAILWNCADDTIVFKFEKIVQSPENLYPTKHSALRDGRRTWEECNRNGSQYFGNRLR